MTGTLAILGLGVATLLSVVLAGVVHEGLHYLSIYPVAEEVRLSVEQTYPAVKLSVQYDIVNDPWRLHYARISDMLPTLLVVGGSVWLLVSGTWAQLQPQLSPGVILCAMFVLIMVAVGGPRDYV